ncbi:MAG TPA: hypothetical protein VFE09_05160, partial [Rubrobacteraceae bacterium]|nr:hypothetical protein [Rubrobacteraceae bacterium]
MWCVASSGQRTTPGEPAQPLPQALGWSGGGSGLGAAAPVASVSEDTEDFAHVHGEAGEADEGHEGMGSMDDSPPSAFGPQVGFRHTFPHPGRYKIWGQFSREGRVITVPYVVEVQ